MHLSENEKRALIEFKSVLFEKVNISDFMLFGSKGKGIPLDDSDIDVYIEMKDCTQEIENMVYDIVFEINLRYEVFISPTIFSKKELNEGPLSESPLYRMIHQEGIRI